MPQRTRTPNMPRKRPKPGATGKPPKAGAGKRRQINLAFPPAYGDRIDNIAEALGLDATQLLRMIVKEHLAEYQERADRVKQSEKLDE